ncbi:MAG: hypothetical protein ACE14T_01910 [Syntrophales bacterium]
MSDMIEENRMIEERSFLHWPAGFLIVRAVWILMQISLVFFSACAGGEGGGGGGPAGLTLNSVTFTPSSVPRGSTQSFTAFFDFSAPDDNLNGGRFNWIYQGHPYSASLPEGLAGQTRGSISLSLPPIPLSSTTGSISIPTSIQDRTGNMSNSVYVTITQI